MGLWGTEGELPCASYYISRRLWQLVVEVIHDYSAGSQLIGTWPHAYIPLHFHGTCYNKSSMSHYNRTVIFLNYTNKIGVSMSMGYISYIS